LGVEIIRKLLTIIYAIYFFAACVFLICISASITLLMCLFDRNRKATHMFSCAWGSHYIYINPLWRFKIEGRELIERDKTYVMVANHQSYFDIFTVYGLFRFFKWVSQEQIFNVPFVGWNMYLNQYVKVVRGNLRSIKQMLKECKAWLDRDVSIMLFPEGTRSETGEIAQFRDGAFRLAIESGVPVVPIVIDGTFEVFPKGRNTMNFTNPIRLKVLPPIDSRPFEKNAAGFRDHVHSLMEKTLHEMRGERISGAKDCEEQSAAQRSL
jgi:1-acyl-sn-glycerol-3-phosphate acyltransferase